MLTYFESHMICFHDGSRRYVCVLAWLTVFFLLLLEHLNSLFLGMIGHGTRYLGMADVKLDVVSRYT